MRVYRHTPAPRAITAAEAYNRTTRAVLTLDRLPGLRSLGVRSGWPQEFEQHAEAIRWIVWGGKARGDKKFKKLRAEDFADIYFGPGDDEEGDGPRPRPILSRADIADAEIAGAWWAALALLPENIDEFRHSAEAFRRGKRSSPWVDDQRIVAWHARGVSLRSIGANLEKGKLSEYEVETRIKRIATDLAQIARKCSRQDGRGNEAVGGSPAR